MKKTRIATNSFDVAMPHRKTMSRIAPMKMYGLRLPQRVTVKSEIAATVGWTRTAMKRGSVSRTDW